MRLRKNERSHGRRANLKPEYRADGQHRQANLALFLLMVVAVFSYIDRNIVSVLQEGIRQDLGLSDTQLGTLTGLGFAIFYTLFALPVARLADIWVRKYVLALALAVWSLMTAGSGFATGFLLLLLFRVGVAVGEAGGAPTSHSVISDFYPRNKRATALSIWGLTVSIGSMSGFILGGWLNDLLGWRNTFVVLGLAGAAFVPIVLLALPEPPRGGSDQHEGSPPPKQPVPSMTTVLRALWDLHAFRYLGIGAALHGFSMIAMLSWNAPFYQRSYGLSATDVGLYLGLIVGIGGGLGTLAGGIIADYLGRRNLQWYVWIPVAATALTIPLAALQYLTPSLYLSLGTGLGVAFLTHTYIGPSIAISQSIVPPSYRAVTAATLLFVTNIVGLGMGPFVTGLLSDTFNIRFGLGAESLRYAILCTLIVNLFAVWAYLISARALRNIPK